MVNCNPYGGISNRMKCIISSIVEYGDINLLWNVPKSGGGVRCEFNDLYKNIFNGSAINSVSDCKFIHPKMNTHNEGGKDNLPADLKKRYIEVIKTLEPIDYITNKIKEEKDRLGDYSAVSVRTFKSFPAEYNSWGRYFKIDNLFKIMNEVEGKILLTCDDTETTNLIKQRYDVYTTPKRTKFGDFTTVLGMQDILIDQYLGGLSTDIYGTNMSSFSEMQWWLGECNPKYINMKLHNK
ncbi:hypothetical protein N9F18_00525 [bacterium]|jgi:hypothetical protein|nr:hypothetical protein [bacterium]